ncbi:hypothetical protein VST7929_01812 [Vibrio stylophorae]|uniref:TadE-like domain-containing protein n=2 Tax=Vibrio stylophorae TaxID=659351 RepID=A0ABN8DVT4_9VIBR|nr:hypothetical protein VST7929_01812 [Vibrio stylophorae]
MQFPRIHKKQRGLAIVEFTIIAAFLLFVLIAIMEFARLMYAMQSLNEMTRRGARLAAVCHVNDRNDIPSLTAITGIAPKGYEPTDMVIEYLDADGNVIAGDLTDDTNFSQIRFVRARINSFTFDLLVPFVSFDVNSVMPDFETTLPAESLGILRPTADNPNAVTNC